MQFIISPVTMHILILMSQIRVRPLPLIQPGPLDLQRLHGPIPQLPLRNHLPELDGANRKLDLLRIALPLGLKDHAWHAIELFPLTIAVLVYPSPV